MKRRRMKEKREVNDNWGGKRGMKGGWAIREWFMWMNLVLVACIGNIFHYIGISVYTAEKDNIRKEDVYDRWQMLFPSS